MAKPGKRLAKKNIARERSPLSFARPPFSEPAVPAFRRRASFGEFEFIVRPTWRYFDGHQSEMPHLVLLDRGSAARFTLGFREDPAANRFPFFLFSASAASALPRRKSRLNCPGPKKGKTRPQQNCASSSKCIRASFCCPNLFSATANGSARDGKCA